ncbi:MAG: hypothetical protein RBT44_07440 [Sphaerochaetaceae bacterium]|nr:hypothetical protein [Sphaerochaetaceae bacterium]
MTCTQPVDCRDHARECVTERFGRTGRKDHLAEHPGILAEETDRNLRSSDIDADVVLS